MTRLIIAGSRDFTDFGVMINTFEKYLADNKIDKDDLEIVTGGARGADKLGEDLAYIHSLKSTVINADWDKYGRSAGIRRNADMAIYAKKSNDAHCLLFWDGESKGTESMINMCHRYGLKYKVIEYKVIEYGTY